MLTLTCPHPLVKQLVEMLYLKLLKNTAKGHYRGRIHCMSLLYQQWKCNR